MAATGLSATPRCNAYGRRGAFRVLCVRTPAAIPNPAYRTREQAKDKGRRHSVSPNTPQLEQSSCLRTLPRAHQELVSTGGWCLLVLRAVM